MHALLLLAKSGGVAYIIYLAAAVVANDVYTFPSVLGPTWDLGLIQFDVEGTGADGAPVLLASIA